MKTIDRLFSAIKAERELVAEQKEVAHRLREVRKAVRFYIIRLAAETAEPRPQSKDYGCGCLVVDGVLWRDCGGKGAKPRVARWPYEEAEVAAYNKAQAERAKAIGGEPCERKRKAAKARE